MNTITLLITAAAVVCISIAAIIVGKLTACIRHSSANSTNDGIDILTKSVSSVIPALRDELDRTVKALNAALKDNREETANSFVRFEKSLTDTQQKHFNAYSKHFETIKDQFGDIRKDNSKKLDEIRKTVDDKLQESLDRRFNESFKLISTRLEEVQKGLGEMQTVANDVGGLKRILTNVKTRGTFGEVQLESILTQILAPEQYAMQASVRKRSQERVDAVVRLPGQSDDDSPLLLPIDSKFPTEDYQRLCEAYEEGNSKDVVAQCRKKFEESVRTIAKDISVKYINPPITTNFAIMFVPSEGIYAEILRCVDLVDALHQNLHVTVVGPTNLAAFLSSLQMGFRTLLIQKRTTEVWNVLGSIKTELEKFGSLLNKVSNNLQAATNTIKEAEQKTNSISKKLLKVESIPHAEFAHSLDTAESAEKKEA